MASETVTVTVDRYRNPAGQPTCCAEWDSQQCQFLYLTPSIGAVCMVARREVTRGQSGWLQPTKSCPVWADQE